MISNNLCRCASFAFIAFLDYMLRNLNSLILKLIERVRLNHTSLFRYSIRSVSTVYTFEYNTDFSNLIQFPGIFSTGILSGTATGLLEQKIIQSSRQSDFVASSHCPSTI